MTNLHSVDMVHRRYCPKCRQIVPYYSVERGNGIESVDEVRCQSNHLISITRKPAVSY